MTNWRYVIVATAAIYILCGATTEINRNVRNNFCNNTCNNNICQGIAEATAVPNNDSCTEYFICSGGHPQPKACPNGQWFNSTASKCDSSENEKCNPKDEFKCPKEGIFFYPHEKFCDKFYMCFAGTAILRHCADGLYFSAESLQCDTPEKAECKLEKCPIDQEKFELIFLPSDVDCEKYYICYEGNPMEQYCAKNIHWNPVTNQCDFKENVNCTIEKPDQPEAPEPYEIPCKSGIYFEGHPNSCEHYFICAAGQSVMLDCAPGFHFDTENNWCDYPEQVKCKANDKSSAVVAFEEIEAFH